MAVAYHPNGPAFIQIGAGGTSGSLSDLGWTRDGCPLDLINNVNEVPADNAGAVPGEVQLMGVTGRLSIPLISFDRTVLNTILAVAHGGTVGQEPVPGTLMGLNGLYKRVVITSPLDGIPFRFRYCYWTNWQHLLKATAEPFTMQLVCLPNVQTAVLSDAVLYDNVAA
jgi:hypothetical protein